MGPLHGAFRTLPDRMQRVQTRMRRTLPPRSTRTRCRFGRWILRVFTFEWLTLWPFCRLLPQMSHEMAISRGRVSRRMRGGKRPGSAECDIAEGGISALSGRVWDRILV